MTISATIKDGQVVNLSYTLKNDKGDILDRADGSDPFTYLHGAQQIVPGLENALKGLKVGDKKKVTVQPVDGYGERSEDLKLIVNKSQFPNAAELEEGMQFEANSPDGQGMVFTVEKIAGDKIHIDGNHPLAGATLHFDVEVLSMREATGEEQEHGHAHGGDGHHHHHEDDGEDGGHGHSH